MAEPEKPEDTTDALTPLEAEFVRFFVQMAGALVLPRSVGEIFGLLFAARDPVPFDEVASRLGISKGSASQGLAFLELFSLPVPSSLLAPRLRGAPSRRRP